jgi:3-methyladenine DNA glycosylase AlkD
MIADIIMDKKNNKNLPSVIQKIINELKSHAKPGAIEGMARYGIVAEKVIGVPAPIVHRLAHRIGKNHVLADKLWATGIYDARILAALIDDENLVTKNQMDLWASDFNNWAICDGCCIHLFVYTPHAIDKALIWSRKNKEYVKRAGFTLMASIAVHNKEAPDKLFKTFLKIIEEESPDERNSVKKAINWALRQIGKRKLSLNVSAICTAYKIKELDCASSRWIAADALRELQSRAVQQRLLKKIK